MIIVAMTGSGSRSNASPVARLTNWLSARSSESEGLSSAVESEPDDEAEERELNDEMEVASDEVEDDVENTLSSELSSSELPEDPGSFLRTTVSKNVKAQ